MKTSHDNPNTQPGSVEIVKQVDQNLSWRTCDEVTFEWLQDQKGEFLAQISPTEPDDPTKGCMLFFPDPVQASGFGWKETLTLEEFKQNCCYLNKDRARQWGENHARAYLEAQQEKARENNTVLAQRQPLRQQREDFIDRMQKNSAKRAKSKASLQDRGRYR